MDADRRSGARGGTEKSPERRGRQNAAKESTRKLAFRSGKEVQQRHKRKNQMKRESERHTSEMKKSTTLLRLSAGVCA